MIVAADGSVRPVSSARRLVRTTAIGAAIAAVYIAAAHFGFRVAFVAEQITTVWAPTGIAIAALLLGGIRLWPAIWIGAFAANAATTAPMWTAAAIATGNTLEAVAAAWLLRRRPEFAATLARVGDVTAFLVVAVVASPVVSATVGVTTLCAAGVQPWNAFAALWWNWWFGDALGSVIVAPAILTTVRQRWPGRRLALAAIFVGGAVIVAYVAFGIVPLRPHPAEYIVFPLVIAAAVSGGPAVTSLVVLGAVSVAVWQTPPGSALVLLQLFMGVLAATALLLAAAIAERRRIEEREREAAAVLRHREEMLSLAQRAGGVATFEWDFRRQTAHCSAEFFAIFGLPARAGVMTAAEWSKYVHPDDRQRMSVHLARALAGEEPAAADYRIATADGRLRWLSYAGKLQSTRDGERMLGIVVDITDRKALERELRDHGDVLSRSEERYRRIFESTGVSLWEEDFSDVKAILDALGLRGEALEAHLRSHPGVVDECVARVKIVDVNPATLRLLGAADKRALVGSLSRIFRPETREVFIGELLALAGGDRDFTAEAAVQSVDGRRVDVLLSVAFPPPDEPPASVLVSLADITGRKQAEIALRREVEVRTALALENERLYQEAEHANRLKDEFLATLSHELRTPLNAVLGWAHMLREGTLQPAMRERALESVERNAKAQAQLVEDLLDVSRIVAGKLQIRSDAVDLAAVVSNAVETVRAGVSAKQLTLELQVPPANAVTVIGDADRLQQVVWNLVSNAIKFTPNGGRVDVELRQNDSAAEIVVCDTGQGIDPAFAPHLFERFRQMDASKTRVHGGLGLGLSIVKHLVEAHGGTVQAESEGTGRGATFRVRLPLRAAGAAVPPSSPPGTPTAANVLAGVRALVVDNEADARDLTRHMLEQRGAAVVTAGSAGAALHRLAHERFDVLVADIGMPEQDGLALIRALRAFPAHLANRGIPAVALTAYAGAAAQAEALDAGFNSHVEKPVEPEALVGAVASLSRIVRP
ncbi:MAG TPA: ATP-binding protein [Vicinamibacterales bacterium]|nr:ATP-binding protein [Vicinamibacterales bacterium]